MARKTQENMRLSDEAREKIGALSGRLGLSRAGVVEMAVRLLAEERLTRDPGVRLKE